MNLSEKKLFSFFSLFLVLFFGVVVFTTNATALTTTTPLIIDLGLNSSFGADFSFLQINEIMYNPQGDDNDQEFVEIYSEEQINLSNFIVADSTSNDTLLLLQFFPGNYSLIVEEGYNYSGINASVYSAGKTIGNNLNDEDVVSIYSPVGLLLDRTAYNSSEGGKNNGRSLEKTLSGDWKESQIYGGTPGARNSVYDNLSDYNESGNQSCNESGNGNYSNETGQQIEPCDLKVEIQLNQFIFNDNFNFSVTISRTLGSATNITVDGTITDSFGKTVKEYSPWKNYTLTNSARKKYSPNLAPGAYLLSFHIDSLGCADTDESNNRDLLLVAINPPAAPAESTLEIEKIYLTDGRAQWADQFEVKVNIYKGNSSKTSVQLWAEKESKVISRRSKLTISDKYQYYSVVLPLQLIPNCANEDSADGPAKIILEGLGQRVEQEFSIQGIDAKICKDYSDYIKKAEKAQKKEVETELEKESSVKGENKTSIYQVIEVPAEIISGEAFRAKVQFFGDKEHEFKVWGYLYRGSKCYSCSSGEKKADDNLIDLKVGEGELKITELLIKADDGLTEGEYNLMIKVNKDGQKTVHNLNSKIYVKQLEDNFQANQTNGALELFSDRKETSAAEEDFFSEEIFPMQVPSEAKSLVVYESNSKIAPKLIPIVLFVAFAFLSLILAVKSRK